MSLPVGGGGGGGGSTFDTFLQLKDKVRKGDLVLVRADDLGPQSVARGEHDGALLTAEVLARNASGNAVGVVLRVWGCDHNVFLPLNHARVQLYVRPTEILR
jgi:hypothetical protein